MAAVFPALIAAGLVLTLILIGLCVARTDSKIDLHRLEHLARIWAMFRHPKLVMQQRQDPSGDRSSASN